MSAEARVPRQWFSYDNVHTSAVVSSGTGQRCDFKTQIELTDQEEQEERA